MEGLFSPELPPRNDVYAFPIYLYRLNVRLNVLDFLRSEINAFYV
jgi:hypothetical protein